jgi:hypothetical protein
MDATHLRRHLQDLSGRRYFLRTLQPDTDRYKLWLGDLVEFVNVAYGPGSPELTDLRDLLTRYRRAAADSSSADRSQEYLERLEALGAFLDRLDNEAGGMA